MILHVYDAAIKSNTGEVYVATPDNKIIDVVKNSGGNAIKTSLNHETGTDRIFEVFKQILKEEPKINGAFSGIGRALKAAKYQKNI